MTPASRRPALPFWAHAPRGSRPRRRDPACVQRLGLYNRSMLRHRRRHVVRCRRPYAKALL